MVAERLTRICTGTFDYFEDADPNNAVSAQLRAEHETIMLQNLKLCTILKGPIDPVSNPGPVISPGPVVVQNDG
jgi:hypothetical protein